MKAKGMNGSCGFVISSFAGSPRIIRQKRLSPLAVNDSTMATLNSTFSICVKFTVRRVPKIFH